MSREGTVVLRVTIDEQGKPVNVDVVQSAGFGFDEEAVRAIRDSTFKPSVRNGKPATSLAELPVRFVLRSSKDE
jgi:protein TonB